MSKLNKKIYYIICIIGILGIADTLFLVMIDTPIHFGIILPSIFGIVLIIYGLIKIYGKDDFWLFKNFYIKNIIRSGLILFIISFIIVEMLILSSIKTEKNDSVKYMIVLGGGLKGAELTETMQNRIDVGLKMLKKENYLKVVVSGGKGFGDKVAEGEILKKYLIDNGIQENRIFAETKATSTMENFKYSKELLKSSGEYNFEKIYVVTSGFHLFRAKILAKRNGFIPYGIPAKTETIILPNNLLREYFAIIKSLIFDR